MRLRGRVALVAGATRGAGRGVAEALGEAGLTVYCTGRSSRMASVCRVPGQSAFVLTGRPETIEETAERVDAKGGIGIPVVCDHHDHASVAALMARIREEHGGLDLLVQSLWGGDQHVAWGQPFWEQSWAPTAALFESLRPHLLTAQLGVPLLLERAGVLVALTDGAGLEFRGDVMYDLVKTSICRLMFSLAEELRPRGVTPLAVTPGFLRSEAMLEHFGVTEHTWRDAADPNFVMSESPLFVGRCIAALAADPDVRDRAGGTWSSWELARAYGVLDADGRRPDWGSYAATQAFGSDQAASHLRFLAGFERARIGDLGGGDGGEAA